MPPSRSLAALATCIATLSPATACLYNPAGPLQPTHPSPSSPFTCPHPIDDTSTSFRPWTHRPYCLRTGDDATTTNLTSVHGAGGGSVYCLYTASALGTSIVATPELASSLSSSVFAPRAFAAPPLSRPCHPEITGATAYEAVEIPGKGKGLVATGVLKRGEVFLSEYPALLLTVDFLRDASAHRRRRLIRRGVERLGGEGEDGAGGKGVHGLDRGRGRHGGGAGYVLDEVLAVNAVRVPLGEGEEALGLWLQFSRINHDCQPNALYRFSPKTLALEVFPYRTIQPGEEITVSYTPISMPRRQRRPYLQQTWGFNCSCALCRSTDEAAISESDHRRERVGELRRTVLQASGQQYFENALVMAHEWLKVGEREGVPPLMAEYYDIVARLSFDVGDLEGARRYALLALDTWTRFGSVDETDLEAAREYVRELGRLGRATRLERKGIPNMFSDA